MLNHINTHSDDLIAVSIDKKIIFSSKIYEKFGEN